MDSRQLALGMAKTCAYFAKQRTTTLAATERITVSLTDQYGMAFISYLEAYGMEAFDGDMETCYESYVLTTRRLTEDTFQQWVEERYKSGERLNLLPLRDQPRTTTRPVPRTIAALTFDGHGHNSCGSYYSF